VPVSGRKSLILVAIGFFDRSQNRKRGKCSLNSGVTVLPGSVQVQFAER